MLRLRAVPALAVTLAGCAISNAETPPPLEPDFDRPVAEQPASTASAASADDTDAAPETLTTPPE